MTLVKTYLTTTVFLLATTLIYANFDLKPEEVGWYIRKFPCIYLNCSSEFDIWKTERFQEIENEWKSKENLIGQNIHKKLWIPLNGSDSLQIELIWREWKNETENYTHDRPLPKVDYLLNGYHFAKLVDNYGYLKPIYWKNETAMWLLLRSEWVYKVPFPPPVMYFMNIEGNAKMDFFYQPVPFWLEDEAKYYNLHTFHGNPLNFTPSIKSPSPDHLIFVVHGIGHQEGEQGVVKNAYSIRKGFIKYLKKFHPTFKIPYVIPVAWRHNLTLHDEKLRVTPLTKFDFINSVGFILNDVFYYWSNLKGNIIDKLVNELNSQYSLFMHHNPNFTGNISILAHSLGSALTFDITNSVKYKELKFEIENIFLIGSPLGRFLAINGTSAEKLLENPWIRDGKLFNILHSDDPVSHRFEVMFNNNYSYAAPSNLFLHKDFRAIYMKSIKISAIEKQEIESFHRYINADRAMAVNHDSFLTIDYLAYGAEFDFQHYNVCDINEMFKDDLKFLRKIFHNRMIRNESQIVNAIAPGNRIKHRFDFDLYRSDFGREEENEHLLTLETKFVQWMGDFGFAHTCYWKRPELIALKTNVIFKIVPEGNPNDTISPYDTETYIQSHPYLIRENGFPWRLWLFVNHLFCWLAVIFLMWILDVKSVSKLWNKICCKTQQQNQHDFESLLLFRMFRVMVIIIVANVICILFSNISAVIVHVTSCISVLVFSFWLLLPKTVPAVEEIALAPQPNAEAARLPEGPDHQEIPHRQYGTEEQRTLLLPLLSDTANETQTTPTPTVYGTMHADNYTEAAMQEVPAQPTITRQHQEGEGDATVTSPNMSNPILTPPLNSKKFWIVVISFQLLYLFIIWYEANSIVGVLWRTILLSALLLCNSWINQIYFCPTPNEKYCVLSCPNKQFMQILQFIRKVLAVGSILFIFLCKQNLITDLGLRSMSLAFLILYLLPKDVQKLINDFNDKKRQNRNCCKCPCICLNVSRHFLQLGFCLGICVALMFLLPSPDILAEVVWNIRRILNKTLPWLHLTEWWIWLIYIALFIPSAFNLAVTEKHWDLRTVYRIIYNYVLVLTALWAINLAIRLASETIRDHDLGCVHSDEVGFCREYIMFNNQTRKHVGPRTDDEQPVLW